MFWPEIGMKGPAARAFLDSSAPGAYGRVSATVRVQNRQRVCGPRIALNGDEHASARRQRVEDPSVVGLEPDAAHGARQTKLRQIVAAVSLQHGQKRASSGHGPDTGEIDPIGRCTQHALNERTGIRSVFGENAQRLDGESSMDQRVEAFLRPRKIVKDTYRKQRDAGLDHGGNVSR